MADTESPGREPGQVAAASVTSGGHEEQTGKKKLWMWVEPFVHFEQEF